MGGSEGVSGVEAWRMEREAFASELVDLFRRVIPEELKLKQEPVRAISVASGHFVEETEGVYSAIPNLRELRAIDLRIPEGVLRIINQRYSQYPGFKLENGDAADPSVVGDSVYDLAILRNPQVGYSAIKDKVAGPWDKIIRNTAKSVKPEGIMLVTAHSTAEFERIMSFIDGANLGINLISQEKPITPSLRSKVPLKEEALVVFKKSSVK